MIPALRRIRTETKDITLVMDAVDEVLKVIGRKPLIDGQLIKDVSITVGTIKVISHNLGRELQGWSIVRQSADCNFWDEQADNVTPSKTLRLDSSHGTTTTLTISLWVF